VDADLPTAYRKKPVEIEAMRLVDTTSMMKAVRWSANYGVSCRIINLNDLGNEKLVVETLEGPITASRGDLLIKGVEDEFYPCKPDIFNKTYDLVGE